MSLPRELREELLSGYMDGELSADERARVEQMLAAEPAVRESLRLLQEQSRMVRDSLHAAPRLDSGFSERVLTAAFAEAERQSLPESHPLQKAAAARPLAHRSLARPIAAVGTRHLVAGLAIAAGLAMAAIFYLDRDSDQTLAERERRLQGRHEIEAAGGNAPLGEEGPSDSVAVRPDGMNDLAPEAEDPLRETADNAAVARSASPPRSGSLEGPASPDRTLSPDEPVALARSASAEGVGPSSSPLPGAEARRTMERAAVSESGAERPSSDQVALRAVLVYEVSLTPLGYERNVINRALREAQIRTADQREIDEKLVGYLRSGGVIGGTADGNAAAEDAAVSVMFLEGSGRRLEKLMMTLLAATEEVHSVGFSLAMDPPVLAAIDSLQKVDPTEIRGEAAGAVAQELAPAGVSQTAPGFIAGSRSFAPLRRDSLDALSALGGSTAEEQPDITAMTFLVIRTPATK